MTQITRKPDYSDLDLDFIKHPVTKDVVKKTGVEAIKRSVRNLILTNYYDRPFRSGIGSNVQKLLFEPISPLTTGFMNDAITSMIRNFEPRIQLLELNITFDYDNNGFNVSLKFYIVNTLEPVITSIFLERIR